MEKQLNQETMKKICIYILCLLISILIAIMLGYFSGVPEAKQWIFGPIHSGFDFGVKIILLILILGLANAIKYNFFDKGR